MQNNKYKYQLSRCLAAMFFFFCSICFSLQAQQLIGSGGGRKGKITLRLDTLPNYKIEAQPAAGFYQKTIELKLKGEEGTTIYYSTDGRLPTKDRGKLYSQLLRIDSTTVVRAIAYNKAGQRGQEHTFSYFFGEDSTSFPIVSIAIEPEYFFHSSLGVFNKGFQASASFPFRGANFYSTREFLCHVEIFESNKERVVAQNIGIALFGGTSRVFPQKSLSLSARKEYGKKRIKHPVFPELPISKYKRLVLRNSGSDFGESHFRDAFITSIGRDMGLSVQAYRPALVFINGRYWGIYNIREKLTKHYIAEHFAYSKDSIDLIKHMKDVKAGRRKHYDQMQQYMRSRDLAQDIHFDSINRMMDTENFAEYQIMQIYIDNQDAGGNIKFWRPQVAGGRWQWLLFDTDFGFGHYSKKSYSYNSLAFHTKADGPSWPNPPWSTFNLRMLLKNKSFRQFFIRRFCDRMNHNFATEAVLACIDSFVEHIEGEMPRHLQRWNLSGKTWEREIETMRTFARERLAYMRKHIQAMYPAVGQAHRLSLSIEGQGAILLNNCIQVADTFSGMYFENLPLELYARPALGYRFEHWLVDGQPMSDSLFLEYSLKNKEQSIVKAVFVSGWDERVPRVFLNELSFRDTLSGDWIELYNPNKEPVSLKGWMLRDAKQKTSELPDIEIPAQGFVVLCKELEAFERVHGKELPAYGGLGFGLDKRREGLELYSSNGLLADSMSYAISKAQAKGLFYLALSDYRLPAHKPERWQLIKTEPSPGKANPEQNTQTEGMDKMGTNLFWVKLLLAAFLASALLFMAYRHFGKKRKRWS